jgi:hypothetical protein
MNTISFTIEKTVDKKWTMTFNNKIIGEITEVQFSRESKYMPKFYDRFFQFNLRGKYHKTFEAAAAFSFHLVLAKKLIEEERRKAHTDQLETANINTRR